MKMRPNSSRFRAEAGILLTECLVYLAVFSVATGLAMAAFYFCWDHTRGVIFTANEVESALRAGEDWRADVRAATGKITVETVTAGETVRIPVGRKQIIYRFAAGELRREIPAQHISQLLLAKVRASEVATEPRAGVAAWRWELELTPELKHAQFPLRFTFEAAQTKP